MLVVNKNNPRLGGLLLDVIPLQLNGFQPLDTYSIATYNTTVNMYLSTLFNVRSQSIGVCS